ncbi:hypothetical protein C0J52_28325, partial [Blattella germanica]
PKLVAEYSEATLATEYKSDSDIGGFLKRFFGVPFLPPQDWNTENNVHRLGWPAPKLDLNPIVLLWRNRIDRERERERETKQKAL